MIRYSLAAQRHASPWTEPNKQQTKEINTFRLFALHTFWPPRSKLPIVMIKHRLGYVPAGRTSVASRRHESMVEASDPRGYKMKEKRYN